MKKKSSGGEGGGANWMDTYGDMVTLLLCFFVLLYSMSTINEEKFKAIAMSFNPNAQATPTQPDIGTNLGPVQDPELDGDFGIDTPEEDAAKLEEKQATIDDAIDQLYEMMKQYIEDSGKNIEITKGDNGVYLSFQNAVFFDGDSWVIRPDGREVLDDLAPMINMAVEYIDEIRILGHTAQANDEHANDVEFDWELSNMRAATVTAYLQQDISLDPARLVSAGYGQHRPVAPNDTEENMRKNRRVEMIITGRDLMNQLGDALEQYQTTRTEGPSKISHEQASPEPDSSSGADSSSSAAEDNSSSQEG